MIYLISFHLVNPSSENQVNHLDALKALFLGFKLETQTNFLLLNTMLQFKVNCYQLINPAKLLLLDRQYEKHLLCTK